MCGFPGRFSQNILLNLKNTLAFLEIYARFSMSGIVEGALLGVAFQEASTALKKGVPYIIRVFSSAACKKLKETLSRLKPIVDEMCELSLKSSSEKWLISIQEFQGNLADGLRLLEECEKTSCSKIHKKFKYANKIQNLEKLIRNFINTILLPNMALNIIKLPDYSCQLENLTNDFQKVASTIDAHLEEQSSIRRTIIESSEANAEKQEWSLCVPKTPRDLVGMDGFLMELKELVLDAEVSVVGITGLSGIGKSTLASALCHHDQIKENFRKIIYIPVSKSPNIMGILTDMWERIVGVPKSGFSNYEAAHNQLQCYIDSSRNQPTLIVLDDVCSESDLQKLLFKGEDFKTLVTTRDERVIRQGEPNASLYRLPLLQEKDALSLFCRCAFGGPNIPTTHDRDLVVKVQEECKGLPVALQVIGRSLRDRDPMFWRSAKNKLSRGETISSYHDALNERLKPACIDELEDHEKECFLDLAAFPEGRTIPANALLDIWVFVRGMDWDDAFVLLWEFADRSLLTLKRDPWSPRIADGRAYGLSLSQHDVIRDLTLYLVKQDNKINCSRLCMPEKRDEIPSEWQKIHSSGAKIVSIHTGAMDEERWRQMEFPEAEALVLYFTASRYCIPSFLGTMKELKVLIIYNYNARRATLRGLNGFEKLSHLKTLQLERLLVPPLYEHFSFLKSLEKLSLSLCEGLGDMSRLDESKFFNFPGLSEFNVDHCNDLEELPRGICSSNSLKLLLVRNCHQLLRLPDEVGKLEKLEVLSLCACARLELLPYSIHSLQQLEILDISQCGSLKGFPDKFQELSRLKKVDIRECRKLPEFCRTLGKLGSLNHVICSEKNEKQLKPLRNVNVDVVEERFDLDWLYYW